MINDPCGRGLVDGCGVLGGSIVPLRTKTTGKNKKWRSVIKSQCTEVEEQYPWGRLI